MKKLIIKKKNLQTKTKEETRLKSEVNFLRGLNVSLRRYLSTATQERDEYRLLYEGVSHALENINAELTGMADQITELKKEKRG